DALLRGRHVALAAEHRDARARRRGAAAAPARPRADDARDRRDRPLLGCRDPVLGLGVLQRAALISASCAVRAGTAGDGARAGVVRASARRELHPLPAHERARELARVSDLAAQRHARAALAASRLGDAARVGDRADLGRARAAGVGARRPSGARDRALSRPDGRVYRALVYPAALLRTAGPPRCDARLDGGMSSLRVFAVGGLLSYRALFAWARPSLYIPTLLGSPLFQILFFAYVGRNARFQDDSFFVVGNAVQVSAMAGVYGMAMAIGGERVTGTLSAVLSSPASRAALFLGRAMPYVLNGILVSTFGFVVGRLLLDFHPAVSSIPALALVIVVSAASSTALGGLLGALALRSRDVLV